jgi:hypothetical protein
MVMAPEASLVHAWFVQTLQVTTSKLKLMPKVHTQEHVSTAKTAERHNSAIINTQSMA